MMDGDVDSCLARSANGLEGQLLQPAQRPGRRPHLLDGLDPPVGQGHQGLDGQSGAEQGRGRSDSPTAPQMFQVVDVEYYRCRLGPRTSNGCYRFGILALLCGGRCREHRVAHCHGHGTGVDDLDWDRRSAGRKRSGLDSP